MLHFERDKDFHYLVNADYPLVALTQADRKQQAKIRRKYTPGILSRLIHVSVQEYLLLLAGLWIILPPIAYASLTLMGYQEAMFSALGAGVSLSIVFILFEVFVAPYLELRSDRMTRILETMRYRPFPQEHTRGRAMIKEAQNIASSVLDSYAWNNGLADKSRDVRSECLLIINDIMGLYSHGTRELSDASVNADLDAIQLRLDDLRHFARHDMTANAMHVTPVEMPLPIPA